MSETASASLSSTAKLETSPLNDDTSSSPVTDGAGDASVLVHVVVVLWVDDESELSDICLWRLQYIILAVKIRIIFWFTCHKIPHTYSSKQLLFRVNTREYIIDLRSHLHDIFRQQENRTTELSCHANYVCSIQPLLIICMFPPTIKTI